jgi:hypothetical protein
MIHNEDLLDKYLLVTYITKEVFIKKK